mgnify:FL=1
MTQLSKRPVDKDVYYSIRDDFLWVLQSIRNPQDVKAFYYDFFTKTERVMFAKRLAVAMMLHKQFSYEDVVYILHVSTSTINRVSEWLDKGGESTKKLLQKRMYSEEMEDFWKKVVKTLAYNLRRYHK